MVDTQERQRARAALVRAFAVVLGASGAPGIAQEVEARWTYAGDNWVPTTLSLGDEGTQAFTGLGMVNHSSRLFSSWDQAIPAPIWIAPASTAVPYYKVRSVETKPVHFKLSFRTTGGQSQRPMLEEFHSSDSTPVMIYEFPFLVSSNLGDVQVSADGETCLAWVWNPIEFRIALAFFDPGNPTPLRYQEFNTWGTPLGVQLSADGSTLYLTSGSKTFILSAADGSILHQHSNYVSASHGHAISGDGRRFAQTLNGGGLHVYQAEGGVYQLRHTYEPGGSVWGKHVAMSRDGRTLVVAYDHTSNLLDVSLLIFDLDQLPGSLVFAETLHGSGHLDNLTSDLAVSTDGTVVALGLWGDAAGQVPELVVYRKLDAWARIYSQELPGSVQRLVLSPDGHGLLVGSKSVHNNTLASGGRIEYFEIAGRDLAVKGVPSIGNRVTIEHRLAPNMLSRSVFAGNEQDPPIPFPQAGTLYIDRSDLHIFAADTADEGGVARTSYTIPNDPSLIGTTVYFQSFQASPRRLSKDWVKMTILP